MVFRMVVAATLGFAAVTASTAAFAGDLRPAPAVFTPSVAAQLQTLTPRPAKRRVAKQTDIAPGALAIGLVVTGAVVGGVVAGTTGSNPATSQ